VFRFVHWTFSFHFSSVALLHGSHPFLANQMSIFFLFYRQCLFFQKFKIKIRKTQKAQFALL